VYDLQGKMREDRMTDDLNVASGGSVEAMTLPRVARDSGVFFVRCEVVDGDGSVLAENVYWQSQQRDDLGDPANDWAFELRQVSWADMTALNWMPKVPLQVSAKRSDAAGENGVTIRLQNPTSRVAFFERAEILGTRDGDEILPIEYSDNYVTVFPGETVEVHGVVPTDRTVANWVRVGGYNSPPVVVPIE
jgi:exo-1,4-beta-D-glucosaminidase